MADFSILKSLANHASLYLIAARMLPILVIRPVQGAGYFKDPITRYGMTDALRDAELLADEILETLTGMLPADVALKRYQTMRGQLSMRLFEATESIASYAWNLDQVRALLRQASSAMREEVEHLESLPNPPMNGPLAHLSVRNTAYC